VVGHINKLTLCCRVSTDMGDRIQPSHTGKLSLPILRR